MMLVSLLPVVLLLSVRTAPADSAASPPLTFHDTDPNTGATLECDRCPPGTYLRARCTSTKKSQCDPCPSGSFTELWNYIGKCLRCGVCGQNQVEKTACTANSDCQCECKQGYYYMKRYDMCLRHSDCPAGQGVLTTGTPHEDTVCQTCLNGSFSDTASGQLPCKEHKTCDGAGQQLVLKGSIWHDSVCTNCQSRDGGDYLKEILLAFFTHQKMPARRLRQIINKLPTHDGKRQGGLAALTSSDLHDRIVTWAASATAKQIEQLPDILTKAGANGAGDKLQSKLQRIESNLKELCVGNEVDEV